MAVETSVIIITRHRPALLAQALGSLQRQTRPLDEIVVVDNGPSEATAGTVGGFAGSLPVRYVVEPRTGYGAARNCGVRNARGRVLMFIDDDCLAGRDWARTLLDHLERGTADIVGGSRTCIQPGLAARLDYLSTDAPVLHPARPAGPAPHLSTSNLAMPADVSRRVGPFDETLSMCEDRDFCARARALGLRIWYEPRARVDHQPPIERFGQYLGRMRHYGLGTSEYFLRRPGEGLAWVFPRSAGLRALLLPLFSVAGTAYLVIKNLPYRPDALLWSPLLLVGQLFWHWGGYEACKAGGWRLQAGEGEETPEHLPAPGPVACSPQAKKEKPC